MLLLSLLLLLLLLQVHRDSHGNPTVMELASLTQVPLRLAWAMSIHKSQGMTIRKLRVDIGNVFEFGERAQ